MYAPLSLHRPELVKAIISLQTCNHNCVLPVVVVAVWEYYTFETKSAFQCNCLILNQMLAVFEAITENIGIAFSSHSITSIGMGCGGGDCNHSTYSQLSRLTIRIGNSGQLKMDDYKHNAYLHIDSSEQQQLVHRWAPNIIYFSMPYNWVNNFRASTA